MSVPSAEVLDLTADSWLESGCKCKVDCARQPPGSGKCVYGIARERGPVQLKACEACGGRTWHAGDGACLRCGLT